MNFLEGLEFNVMQPIGVNVVAFAIKMTKFEQWKNLPLCTLEKLEWTENISGGRVQKTFSIPYSGEDEDVNVIIATLAKNRCVIGYGHVENNQFVSEDETIQLEYMSYGESEVEARNYTFTYNPKRQIILLDVETGEQVIPSISAPDVFGNLKGTYKLIPYKNYIALEMNVMVTLKNEDTKGENIEDLANVLL
jgi:hypothetical protein